MKSHGGYDREEYGKPVDIKGPKSVIMIEPKVDMMTDAQADRKAGYKGVTVTKKITK